MSNLGGDSGCRGARLKRLELSGEQLRERREEYISDEKAFLMLDCDCELCLFEEIPDAAEELKEWVKCQEEDEQVSLAEDVTLVPFGKSGGGDMYCFLYRRGTSEPEVIRYFHDEYGAPEVAGHTFDEFIYLQMLDAAANGEDIDGAHFTENLKFLDEKYRELITGKTADELIEDYDSFPVDEADIWV